jgi:jumonji domain-containing protein 2
LVDKGVPWNLAELKTLLNHGLGKLKIPGVSSPYVYIGTWKSMFGWHKEDIDLYSINYLHHGLPKFWYSINLSNN